MSRLLTIAPTLLLLAAATWVVACGDGTTDPPPPDPPRATTVTVAPATAELTALGETVRFTAQVLDQNGQAMAGAPVAWSSGDASVAMVDASGLATTAGNGTATITATSGSASGSAAVTVAQVVSAVTMSPAADTLVAWGDTLRLVAEATDANGHALADAEFAWASGDTAVVTVDDSGLVTSVGAGETEVTATASGIEGGSAITVVDPVAAAIAVTPGEITLTALGRTAQLAVEVRDQIGRAMEGATVSWSSSDTAVATVDSAGLVTAIGGGTATVTASAGEVSAEAQVTVMQSAGSVVVTPVADTVSLGDTLRLAAEAFDDNGHAIADAEFEWWSSDVSVATVDGSGLVRGVAEGAATITAASADAQGTSGIRVENPDRAALVALYKATDGPAWVDNTNWLTDAPLGEWYGVDTDASGRVVGLRLAGRWDSEPIPHGLTGPIPAELGNLSRLTELDLHNNQLIGPIPAELGNLANLQFLNLGYNPLGGPIPVELGSLANLRDLQFRYGQLSGPVPAELGNLDSLRALDLAGNRLTGPIPPELGNLSRLYSLGLWDNDLSGPIPAELGSLANLRNLYLSYNQLTGPIPAELGNLGNLLALSLEDNSLTDPIPRTFLRLTRLRDFSIGRNQTACVPGSSVFVAWLRGIEHRDDESEGIFCNAADAAVLKQLYERAGGTGWTRSDGWADDGALEEWHGVNADSLGRVTALDLTANRLNGRLPATIGELAWMTELRVADNPDLSGRLPLSLAKLSLDELRYAGTGLCVPADQSFEDWLNTVSSHEGTGTECAPLSDREILEALYDVTDGPNWTNSENWLTDAALDEWHGVRTSDIGVSELLLANNGLSGPIPSELGDLSDLRTLSLFGDGRSDEGLTGPIPPTLGRLSKLQGLGLGGNKLTGPIPSELGNLTSLWWLALEGNNLSGPIPPELGKLTNLQELWAYDAGSLSGPLPPEFGDLAEARLLSLGANDLTGPIPPELAKLRNLKRLYLGKNNLGGPIPRALGELPNLEVLWLQDNDLTGPVPPELGELASMHSLILNGNSLTGPVPPAFGRLANLTELQVTNNADMSGALPGSLTALGQLEKLTAGGTGLCAPTEPGFLEWLDGVVSRRVALCSRAGPSVAYLTQTVQSREWPVPLVAGKPALLRVFPTSQRASGASIPLVRARLYLNGAEIHTVDIPGTHAPIPAEIDEGALHQSANAEIPGEFVQPGLEIVVEIDPAGTLDPELGIAKRIPETGRLAMDVRTLPILDLTVIPFLWTESPDSAVLELVAGMAADPYGHELLSQTHALLPVGDVDVTAHEPVLSSSNNVFELLNQTEAIRVMEGGGGHYMSMMTGESHGAAGVAYGIGSRSSFSRANAGTIAHELGHNMNLFHAPCGGAGGPDPSFPYADGSIGAWGYDFRDGGRLVDPGTPDLMSYCGPPDGTSDYHFTNALRYRLFDEGAPNAATRSLLLWGGTSAEGQPLLEPTFVVDAPPALPDSAGAYRITGRTGGGASLFSLSFAMHEMVDGEGGSSFVFAVPVRPEWAGALASITLSGPDGSVTLDGGTARPMAILRDPRTGQVRGFLRDPPPPTQAVADAAGRRGGTGLRVLFSRGIPGAGAWRR